MSRKSPKALWFRLKDGTRTFFEDRVWQQPLPPALSAKGLTYRVLRTVDMVYRGFGEDGLRLHAASLTYATLISLVPILALSLAILKGLGYDNLLQTMIAENAQEMPAQFQDVLNGVLKAVSEANFAKIGSIGAITLFLTVVQMLSRIETSFNRIWHVTRDRALVRRFSNYLSILLIVPLLLITAITVTARIKLVPDLQWGELRLAPFLATWIALSFLYGAMPNTRVRFLPSAISGLVGAVLWVLWFRFYITLQPGVARYNIIYGTLATIPFFLVWLYISWNIVLLGAKVTYAVQNGKKWRESADDVRGNVLTRTAVAMAILRQCVAAFRTRAKPFHEEEYTRLSNVNPSIIRSVLQLLETAKLVVMSAEDDAGYTFVLARDPAMVTVGDVLGLVQAEGESLDKLNPTVPDGFPERSLLEQLIARSTDDSLTLAELMNQEDPLKEDPLT